MNEVAAKNGTAHRLRMGMETGGLGSPLEVNTFCLPNAPDQRRRGAPAAASDCWTVSRIGGPRGYAAIDFRQGTMVLTHQTAEKLIPDVLKVCAAEVTK